MSLRALRAYQGIISGYAAPESFVLIPAPILGRQRLVITLILYTPGNMESVLVEKVKGSERIVVHTFSTKPMGPAVIEQFEVVSAGDSVYVLLENVDESLEITITEGSADVHFAGTFLAHHGAD